ncbi:alpha/beta fold hydrolase [Asanoa ferruginea]|nr:alpha/beta hydrolase [Asanoa ferruginea]
MYTKAKVKSADGTLIGYRRYGGGDGLGLVLLHGGMKAAQHFSVLAETLTDDFQVYVPDRRGRGMSGPHGAGFSVEREVEDLRAVLAETGARYVFGLSVGGLITLRTALETSTMERIALFEPPLSVSGSFSLDWLPRYRRELAGGRRASALVTSMRGMAVEPLFTKTPRYVLTPALALGLHTRPRDPDRVSIADLVPTLDYDMRTIEEVADTAREYAAIRARVLLLRGTRSPDYFTVALDALSAAIPQAERRTLPGLTHDGPEDDGRPLVAAQVLREFFTAP